MSNCGYKWKELGKVRHKRIWKDRETCLQSSSREPHVEAVAINNPFMDVEFMVYQFNYDSVHGRHPQPVSSHEGKLVIGDKAITVVCEKDLAKLPWGALGINCVLECTGVFTDRPNINFISTQGQRKSSFQLHLKTTF